jgi:hypothetical protein
MLVKRWGSLGKAAIVLLGAFVWTSLAATQAMGNEVRGLVFRDNRPLSLSWTEAQAGTTARLCNVGRADAPSVVASLAGFAFTQHSKPAKDGNVLESVVVPPTIAAGRCVQLSIKVKQGVGVDPGNYEGVLVATSAGAGIARLPVTIAGPVAVPKPAAIAGAVATVELRAIRNGPWGDTHLEDGGKLPLKPPRTGEQLAVGEDCQLPKHGKPPEQSCPFVGNLYNGTRAAHVYVNGRPEMSKGAVLLPLRVEGADKVGDYEGSLDLAQTGKAENAVSVKLTVTDAWWWAALAVALGAALLILLQLWSGRWRPEKKLHERCGGLRSDYSDGETSFHTNAPGFANVHRPTDEAIAKYSQDVNAAIRAYAESSLLFDPASEAYKKIDESIALAEKDADFLGKKDGLGRSLSALKDELDSLAAFLSELYPVAKTPQLARNAASVLKGGNLEVGEATTRAATGDAYATVLKQWRQMAERVLRYEAWARLLAALAATPGGAFSDEDKKLLARTFAKLVEVRMELLDATNASDIEHLGTSRDLDSAYQDLAELGSRHGLWAPPTDPKPTEIDVNWQALDFDERLLAGINLTGAGIYSVETWIQQAADLTVHAAQSVDIDKVSLWLADVGALIVAVAVGIATGLSIVYFGKTFGTVEDYITVILVGAASQVLAKGVLDRAAVLWAADTAPPVAQDPQRAAVAAGD